MYVITLYYFLSIIITITHFYICLQEEDLFNYFRNQLHINDNQLFVVVTGDNNNWIASEDTQVDQQQIQSLERR